MASSMVYRSALFVDFDNVFISLEEHSKQAANNFGSQPMRWLSWLEKSLLSHVGWESTCRRILSRRVYLNPRQFGRFRNSFVRCAFETVDTPALTSTGKTSADIHMVLDIMELLDHPTRFDEFIILSADADFAPVLIKLRKWDRRTTILAVGEASPSYLASGDLVLKRSDFLAVLLEEKGVESIRRRHELSPSERADIKQCEEMLLKHVRSAAGPVFMSVLAKHVRDAFPRIAADWSGYSSFKEFLTGLSLPDLAISNISPGFVYDPTRHEHLDALTGTFDRGESFRRRHPTIEPVARKVYKQTDTPFLLPDQYATIFRLIADDINRNGYNLTTVSKSVRDRCKILNLAISRQQISFILRGIVFADHLLGRQLEDPIDLANHFLQNTYALCESSQLILSADEREAVACWLTGGEPITEPLSVPTVEVSAPPFSKLVPSPQGGPPIFVKVDESRLAAYSQWVRDYIAGSDNAVPLATLATELHSLFPELVQDWGGCKTLKLLLRQLELDSLELSSESPGFIFDPSRHKLPSQQPTGQQAASAREIVFRREYPHLYEVAQKLRSSIDMPYLLPEEYAAVFVETAREVNAAGFDLSETSKRVRDRCRGEKSSIARHPINIILRWIMFADHPLGRQPETPDVLARRMFENMGSQCQERNVPISEDEKELVRQWLTLALPENFEVEMRSMDDTGTAADQPTELLLPGDFGAGIMDETSAADSPVETPAETLDKTLEETSDELEHVNPIVSDGLSVQIDHGDMPSPDEDLGFSLMKKPEGEPPDEGFIRVRLQEDSIPAPAEDADAAPPTCSTTAPVDHSGIELGDDSREAPESESEGVSVSDPFPGSLDTAKPREAGSVSPDETIKPRELGDMDVRESGPPQAAPLPESSSEDLSELEIPFADPFPSPPPRRSINDGIPQLDPPPTDMEPTEESAAQTPQAGMRLQSEIEGPMEMLTEVGSGTLPELPSSSEIFADADSLPTLPEEVEFTSVDPSDTTLRSIPSMTAAGEADIQPSPVQPTDGIIFDSPPAEDSDTVIQSDVSEPSPPDSDHLACEVTFSESLTDDSGLLRPERPGPIEMPEESESTETPDELEDGEDSDG